MRTTLNLDDALLSQASKLLGTSERSTLVHEGLRALIQRESASRLAKLGGTQKTISAPPRRRIK